MKCGVVLRIRISRDDDETPQAAGVEPIFPTNARTSRPHTGLQMPTEVYMSMR
jgi:hypothetical protein